MINGVALATAVVGGASAFVCLACVATIFAHGRDLVSMRDRIIVGLLLANTVFSSANAVPVNSLGFSGGACGKPARLQKQDLALSRALRPEKVQGHKRRLARARWGDEHGAAADRQRVGQLIQNLGDG